MIMSTNELIENETELRETGSIPLLFEKENFKDIFPEHKKLFLFLDFDGTLSQIVNHPEDACITDEMKEVLEKCAAKFKVAIVSGRDMNDVKRRVGIDNLIYAGSHGFRITGPGGLSMEYKESEKLLPALDQIEEKLQDRFSDGPKGVQIERKRYAIAVHYRNADEGNLNEIKNKIKNVLDGYSEMKTGKGKKIIEIKPDLDWHKGNAIKWILDNLGCWNNPEVLPAYVGDDVTDEDGFKMLYNNGVGILVGSHGELSAARYKLNDVDDVYYFLQKLFQSR